MALQGCKKASKRFCRVSTSDCFVPGLEGG